MRIIPVLLLALLVLTEAAWLRAPEYDESYSIFLTAGDARPAWPSGIFQPSEARGFYQGHASLEKIAQDLRKGDVHPPLYFWLLEYWRRAFGPGWFAARMLSVLLSIAGLAGLAWLAELTQIPASSAVLIALLSYGFAYTGIVARGFALAQALNILGMALLLSATRTRFRASKRGFAAGLCFGAAGFSNYLAVFVGLAASFWLLLNQRRRGILLPEALGFSIFLPLLIFFFMAQHNARTGQFQAFSLPHALALLAKDSGATWFGGLPIYAGRAGGIVTAALSLLTFICAGFTVKNWAPELLPFALAAGAVPAGLIALGLLFNNTPIEIRYLAFATPFTALLLARTLPALWRHLFIAVEAAAIIGLSLAPATMQPQAIAARQIGRLGDPQALVLLPFGNDGVGVPGPFIAAAPDRLRIELIKPGSSATFPRENIVVLASLRADAASSQATANMLKSLQSNPCWSERTADPLLQIFIRTCNKD